MLEVIMCHHCTSLQWLSRLTGVPVAPFLPVGGKNLSRVWGFATPLSMDHVPFGRGNKEGCADQVVLTSCHRDPGGKARQGSLRL